jgi:hypothetical protein
MHHSLGNWDPRWDGCAPGEDPTTVVGCQGTPYWCATVSDVDGHIGRLYDRIRLVGLRSVELVQQLWADIDLLLDRRVWLLMEIEVNDAR